MSDPLPALFKPMAGRGLRLGFGCADLPVWSPRRSLSMLACAYDHGIRHFDVARMYGYGQAEAILGTFLRGRRGEVTITTKFGIDPPAWSAKARVKASVREAIEHMPALHALVQRARAPRQTSAPSPPSPAQPHVSRFTVDLARQNLETSLRLLQTDCIDIWLLHEADGDDAVQPELLRFLEDVQRQGKVRTFGIGSASWRIQRDADRYPPAYRVLQFDNDALRPTLPRVASRPDTLTITHGAMRVLPELGGRASAALLLRWALRANRNGGVLFSSRKRERIAMNLAAINDVDDAAIDAFDRLAASLRK